ncbi:MAG: hypothetical protein C0507_10005 [Cyanobacteria bacterium PR.3.49]|nr:hypothetical protein [Cyanobacteria bacterium PR.3.49]
MPVVIDVEAVVKQNIWTAENMKKAKKRSVSGSSMTEFSGALIIFILFMFLPLINIGIMPVRYLIAHGTMSQMVHRMAVCEKRTDAVKLLQTNTWWTTFLSKWGVAVKSPEASIVIVGKDGSDKTSVKLNNNLSNDLLPNADKGPFMYSIQLSAKCDIAPLFNGGAGLPGFTKPVTFNMSSQAQWENLGRDPVTAQYYINE